MKSGLRYSKTEVKRATVGRFCWVEIAGHPVVCIIVGKEPGLTGILDLHKFIRWVPRGTALQISGVSAIMQQTLRDYLHSYQSWKQEQTS